MNEILDYYQQQAKERRATLPWLAQMQSAALDDLSYLGFPTRHHEEWKYTRVDELLKQQFTSHYQVLKTLDFNTHTITSAQRIVIQNGLVLAETSAQTLPPGVVILPLSEAVITHEALVKQYLGTILPKEHAFQALNTAMLYCGVFIYVPKGVRIEAPVVITHVQDKAQQAVYLRHLIVAEEDCSLVLVEEYQAENDACYLTNTATEISVGVGAQVTHYKIQNESKAAYHLGHLAVKQFASSQCSSHSLSIGGKLVRSDISFYLEEEHAHCLMNGIYAPSEGQHVDHHTTVHHLVPNCQSDQDYKGVLKGESRAVFNGKVIVAKGAHHTRANQQNKNLLLSAQAEVDTKPQLEIFADDVLCSHGATVGQLDEEALFYLATRGIDKIEASHYLIHAFAQTNLELIPNPQLAGWMSHLLTQQLG